MIKVKPLHWRKKTYDQIYVAKGIDGTKYKIGYYTVVGANGATHHWGAEAKKGKESLGYGQFASELGAKTYCQEHFTIEINQWLEDE